MTKEQLKDLKEFLIRTQAWFMARYNRPIDDEHVEELQSTIDLIHDLINNY